MEPLSIDWKRVRMALSQEARRRQIQEEKLEATLSILPAVIGLCGKYSQSRKMAVRVGRVLLGTDAPEFVVPTCPAYPNRSGRYHKVYTLGSGVSLLTKLHLPFLERLAAIVPTARVTILVADFEAEDRIIRRATGLTRDAFVQRVRATTEATAALMRPRGWNAQPFSEYLPTFAEERGRSIDWIRSVPAFMPQLRADTLARRDFYRLYYPDANDHQMIARTVKAAAEYTVLGRTASLRGQIVVNHCTTSLAWYLRTDVALLHDAVRTF